jgi:hypothetical protein
MDEQKIKVCGDLKVELSSTKTNDSSQSKSTNDIITPLHCLILHLSNTTLRQTQDRDKGQKGAWPDSIFNLYEPATVA